MSDLSPDNPSPKAPTMRLTLALAEFTCAALAGAAFIAAAVALGVL